MASQSREAGCKMELASHHGSEFHAYTFLVDLHLSENTLFECDLVHALIYLLSRIF